MCLVVLDFHLTAFDGRLGVQSRGFQPRIYSGYLIYLTDARTTLEPTLRTRPVYPCPQRNPGWLLLASWRAWLTADWRNSTRSTLDWARLAANFVISQNAGAADSVWSKLDRAS